MAVGMRVAGSIGAAAALLLFPVAAQAKTKTVFLGLPTAKAQKQFQSIGNSAGAFTEVNDFFPHGVKIHVGDKVKFAVNNEFHTFDLPKKGGKPLSLVSPTGTAIAGVNDEAGIAFWFNGQQNLAFTPALLTSNFGKKFTYKGTKEITSGVPLGPAPPLTVKFTKTGNYKYYCNIHAGMFGVVHVVRKGKKVPTARADRKAVKKQLKRDLKQARNLANTTAVPANTLDVGASAGKSHVEYYGMLPGSLTVKAGTILTFRMGPKVTDVHTAAFGTDNPGDPSNTTGYLATLAKTFQGPGPFDPRAIYPSDTPGTPVALSPTTHGNGFWNSGAMDTNNASPLPPSGQVTFNTPGTYNYYCLIHTNMHGTITVTP